MPNPQAGYLTGWNVEIALDIDWAHAIAPGAKILVVATDGQDSQDFEASMQYIIDNDLGNAVSDSSEEDVDLLAGAAEQEPFEPGKSDLYGYLGDRQSTCRHPLGQASPTIAALKTGVQDVLPIRAPFSGSYTDSGGTTKYTADSLFAYLVANNNFSNHNVFATIWDQPEYGQASVFAFALDSSLSVTPRWDNATGYGTPMALSVVDAAPRY